MNRLLALSLVLAILSGCGSSGPGASPSPAATSAATDQAPSISPSFSPTTAPTVSPTVDVTERPTPPSTPRPTPFPTRDFEALSENPVPEEVAAMYQSALAAMAGVGGITATVMTPDGTWSAALGKADDVDDMAVESQFGIGSVTKSIIAAQVMQLVEADEIALDDAATDHLPDNFDFDTNGATIRQLLSHRSGIPDWYGDAMRAEVEANRTRVWTPESVLALVDPARSPAGEAFEYADTNYNLLGLVIEHVRQEPLIDVLRDGVLRVEGTERLIYQPDEAPSDPMAMPLGESREALAKGGGYLPSLSDASSAGPAGSIASDSISLARWWRAFCAGEIVSEASLTEMSTLVGGPEGYGLGLFYVHYVRYPREIGLGHVGGNFGFSSWAGCMHGDRPAVIVVLTNFWVDNMGGLPAPLLRAALSD